MNNQCVAYVSDVEYLFPTLLSALQARKFSTSSTDICVLMSESIDDLMPLKDLLAANGVQLVDATDALRGSLERLDSAHFQARISESTMAKLVLPQILPEQYEQIIYLDGDTQVVGSLEGLEKTYAQPGKFFAARDYTAIVEMMEKGKTTSYFNAGVLKFNREGWIGAEAFNLFVTNPDACDGRHDQGALNAVCGSALTLMSNRWNFPKHFLHWVDMSSLSIVHYMAHPKPWHGTFFPWGPAESRVYKEMRKASPLYDALYRGISIDRMLVYKYRSTRDRLKYKLEKVVSDQSVQRLLVGDYAI